MGKHLVRARFTFGQEYEVRYVGGTPAIGDYVGHGRELWVVSRTSDDALGLTVVCKRTTAAQELSPIGSD